jgi:hypothetical protein
MHGSCHVCAGAFLAETEGGARVGHALSVPNLKGGAFDRMMPALQL